MELTHDVPTEPLDSVEWRRYLVHGIAEELAPVIDAADFELLDEIAGRLNELLDEIAPTGPAPVKEAPLRIVRAVDEDHDEPRPAPDAVEGQDESRPVPSDDELLSGLQRDQERRGVLPNSILTRRRRVKRLMAWMAPRSILDATREDIETHLDGLAISPMTRRDYLGHFHSFFTWAHDEELVDEVPTRRIPRPKKRQRLPRPISDEDLTRAIALAPNDQLRCFLLLGAYQGLRCQEIAGLHVEDVDPANGLLRVRDGKGSKERSLPLHPEVTEALKALPMPPDGPIFLMRHPDHSGQQIEPHNVGHQINRFLHRCEIRASAHQLRHWFATNVYRTNTDLRLTQHLLGHSSPTTTAIYAAFDPAKAGPTVAALGVDKVGPGA